ncbi:MAG TPA: glycosyltransferase family 4 protein [Verrucomicrobiota bacterium]|nr:glycosyltransferase family 4 protein [Verrucomicrobiota bacterium]
MRLSHFFTYYRSLGGVQSILKRHHTSDAKRGHESNFLLAFEPNDFHESDIAGLGFSGGYSIRSMRGKFANQSRRFTDSLAICHNMWGLQFLADLMPAKRRIGLLHSDWTGLQPHLKTQRSLLDGVLCVSNALVERVSSCLPDLAKENRIELIPYPIDSLAAMPVHPPLAKRTVVIGWIGRIQSEQKHVERLPSLAKALGSAGIDFRLELLGDGPKQTWLEQHLPNNRTVFHGRKSGDDYRAVLSGWDFVTSVSDYEGLPISMLEAFSAGVLPLCPAIGSGGDEYAAKLGDEFVWKAFDFRQAAAKLKTILAKPESALGQARIDARALTRYHCEAEYFRVFDEFLQRIDNEPRVSAARLAKRPFYFSDQLPFGLITRFWASGCTQRND